MMDNDEAVFHCRHVVMQDTRNIVNPITKIIVRIICNIVVQRRRNECGRQQGDRW
jgi:hypothetical protein